LFRAARTSYLVPFLAVVTDHDFPNLDDEEQILRPIGIELRVADRNDRRAFMAAVGAAEALLSQYAPIDAPMIAAAQRCLAILRYGVGVDTIDLDAATKAGICVANVPDYGTQEVALHALSLMLAVHRRLRVFDASVRGGRWIAGPTVTPPIHRLRGQTLGIVGFGRIGRTLGAYAAALGVHVLAYDPYITRTAAGEAGATLVDYGTLLRQSDIISFHAPLTDETRHMFGEQELRILKPSAIVINTARGGIVDTNAVARALREGRLAGAGLDVFEEEPLPANHLLREAPNTFLTPHVAWYSEEARRALKRSVAEDVARVARGEWPRSLVNPDVRSHARLTRKQ
jgi:D-3-phosphoglycerate dehydrogenase / 2-oxoglutarate reductase